jgi:hypothetical protein
VIERDVMWAPREGPGLEHLHLSASGQVIRAEGVIIGLFDDRPFRIHYQLRCDTAWALREIRVHTIGTNLPRLHLHADGGGRWAAADGRSLPALDGCIDVDLSASPFTNTLPIRRLGLDPGESAELAIVYIDAPALGVTPVRQRYTRLPDDSRGALYRYESLPYAALPEGFLADLPVDADGLVLDYPGLFRRAWPSSTGS